MGVVTFTSYIRKDKNLVVIIGIIGVVAVSYGMLTDNDLIFIIGLVPVCGCYLLMRRSIKESIRNKA